MKNISTYLTKIVLILVLAMGLMVLKPLPVRAYTSVANGSKIAEAELYSAPATSGFVDENGKPLSQEEYDKIRAGESGVQWQNIIILGVVLVGLVTGMVMIVRKKRAAK